MKVVLIIAMAAALLGCAAAQDRFASQDPIAGLNGRGVAGPVSSLIGKWGATVTQDDINLIIKKDTKGKFLQTIEIAEPLDNTEVDGLAFLRDGAITQNDPNNPGPQTAVGQVRLFVCDSRFKGRAIVIADDAELAAGPLNYLVQVYKRGRDSFLAGAALDADLSDLLAPFILQYSQSSADETATKFPSKAASECGFLSI